jgi:hypothetical protein
MSRALFIGDSQTCGYWSHPTKVGPGSYSYWNDNNYAEIYGEDNNKPVAIYAMAGVCNRVYTDWLAAMFKKYDLEVALMDMVWGSILLTATTYIVRLIITK